MKIHLTLIAIVLINVFSLQSQIKLTPESHGFLPGNEHQAKKVVYKDPGASGINRTWDFQELTDISEVNVSPVVAIEEADCNVGISRNDGLFFFYQVADDRIEYRGYRRGAYTYYFSKPIVKIMYPEGYGTSFEGTFEGDVLLEGESRGAIHGTYATDVDAKGTILLPGAVALPVIRSKTVEKIEQWGSDKRVSEIVKYLWYAQDVRYPVFLSVEVAYYHPQTGERIVTERTSFLNMNLDPEKQDSPDSRVIAAVDDVKPAVDFSVAPNPFTDRLSIHYTLPQPSVVSIELFNMQGAKLETILSERTQQGEQTVSYDAGRLAGAKGSFILKLTIDGTVYDRKLVKQ